MSFIGQFMRLKDFSVLFYSLILFATLNQPTYLFYRLKSGSENTLNDLTGRLETLIDKNYSNVKSSYQIGEDGENFVLSSLTSAFPNNTGTIYIRTVSSLKVRKSQKQIFLASILPKRQQKFFHNFCPSL